MILFSLIFYNLYLSFFLHCCIILSAQYFISAFIYSYSTPVLPFNLFISFSSLHLIYLNY